MGITAASSKIIGAKMLGRMDLTAQDLQSPAIRKLLKDFGIKPAFRNGDQDMSVRYADDILTEQDYFPKDDYTVAIAAIKDNKFIRSNNPQSPFYNGLPKVHFDADG